MRIPEAPHNVVDLDLMKKLDAYANGQDTWYQDGGEVGDDARKACAALHSQLTQLIDRALAPLLDRTMSREMETFTMHDRAHGQKVAHLVWHTLKPERRLRLTPPEIGLLVASAYFHDVGMALNTEEREARLNPDSDLWNRLELDTSLKQAMSTLKKQATDEDASESVRGRFRRKLNQAEEAMLCQDSRSRHATRERYQELMDMLTSFHRQDQKIPDARDCMSFDTDCFADKLLDICVSHGEDAEMLAQSDQSNISQPRFARDYPFGCSQADLHMVAASLRLADLLDFDRERTPPVLYHYLLPTVLDLTENRSALEWRKHLAISNWHITDDTVVFRGRCDNHIVHHAIVHFCTEIQQEIDATRSTFGALRGQHDDWPFLIPSIVKADITEVGYTYIPYRFELDDARVYSLLMGRAIYDEPLVAVRELIQNAVDACKLRDAITQLSDPHLVPQTSNRITVRYEEPTKDNPIPRLSVIDTGTGMDAFVLERYFLKIGRSFYNSSDFNEIRVSLTKRNLDFAPVSEFGIGFLSCFLLADHVEVETAMWEPLRSDTLKRTLRIDGPTRLIRLDQDRNDGTGRFKGTRIALSLTRGSTSSSRQPPSWEEVNTYLGEVCQDLPYVLELEHVAAGSVDRTRGEPLPLQVDIPAHFATEALRITVHEDEVGMEGEIGLIPASAVDRFEREQAEKGAALIVDSSRQYRRPHSRQYDEGSILLRGGFNVGTVPGLPSGPAQRLAFARIRLNWQNRADRRYQSTNLARTGISDEPELARAIQRIWLSYLLDNVASLPDGFISNMHVGPASLQSASWLEDYTALHVYSLARSAWASALLGGKIASCDPLAAWEAGEGEPLPIGRGTELSTSLLSLALPRICDAQVSKTSSDPWSRLLVTTPIPGWREVLAQCSDFISNPPEWGLFMEYAGDISDFLYYTDWDGNSSLNALHADLFSAFAQEDVQQLPHLFLALAQSRALTRRPRLTTGLLDLLTKVTNVAADLHIGYERASWPLGSFSITDM